MTQQNPALPGPSGRWTASRKEALLTALRRGEITEDRACAVYALSPDELRAWRLRFAARGQRGLKQRDLRAVRTVG